MIFRQWGQHVYFWIIIHRWHNNNLTYRHINIRLVNAVFVDFGCLHLACGFTLRKHYVNKVNMNAEWSHTQLREFSQQHQISECCFLHLACVVSPWGKHLCLKGKHEFLVITYPTQRVLPAQLLTHCSDQPCWECDAQHQPCCRGAVALNA